MSSFRISRPSAFSVPPQGKFQSVLSEHQGTLCLHCSLSLRSSCAHFGERMYESVFQRGCVCWVWFPWVSTLLSSAQPKEAIPCIWETWEMSPDYTPHGAPFLAQHVPAVGLGFGWVLWVLLLVYWGLLAGNGWQVGREHFCLGTC